MDEEEFSFDDGKRDFDEIIELSDFSTRSAKDMTSKEARAQWWEERQALDTRLHELLVNIENIWLGGFKGIFSQHPREPTSLESFHKSFEAILDRHLPSRGKSKKKKAALDPRVLDLFIGLGDATDEQLDLDEALMDLIYFVVDILQFNGERNAYDEIDFDAIVIETLDALRTYHNACQGTPPGTAHTILILDKSLHVFPWESLPCLQSLAISRLPSLQALRDRILAAKGPEVTENAEPGHYISAAAGGTSILNPSLDLTHTLKTIKPRLDDMQGDWTHMVSRAPSEEQFESALKNKDLLLYFGHGSGAQFVKSKSVRRLYAGSESTKPGCATTLLFGCSSVHLTENGIYESSGMLASYLTAGAPAVVGMLWDVTDKDCDRVAVKAGELWGLWPEMSEEKDMPKIGKKAREKKKAATAEVVETDRGRSRSRAKKDKGKTRSEDDGTEPVTTSGQRGVGLDEALRQAREECVLRYLNGAAAVVYGIPVYLE
jgi:separase